MSIIDHYEEDFQAWQEWARQDPSARPFTLDVAPDRLRKDNTSGGAPYGIIVPDPCADGQFTGEKDDDPVPFVSYLNGAFAHGGFPYGECPWLPSSGKRGPGQEVPQPGSAAPLTRLPTGSRIRPGYGDADRRGVADRPERFHSGITSASCRTLPCTIYRSWVAELADCGTAMGPGQRETSTRSR